MRGQTRVALTGKMRSGKDVVARELVLAHNFHSPFAFGDSLKYYAHEIFPDVPKEPKPRELYQFMNVMRDFDPDVWVKHLAEDVDLIDRLYSPSRLVVKDARQPNEIEWLRDNNFYIVKVEASYETRRKRAEEKGEQWDEEAANHPTEALVDEIEADFIITNEGSLSELEAKVNEMMRNIKAQ